MPQFVKIPDERSRLYSPVALQPVDTFTLERPIGPTRLVLQEEFEPDVWLPVDATPIQSSDGVFSYPGLGHAVDVDRPPRTHRVVIESEYYELYVPPQEQEFLVQLYNDSHPLGPGEYAQQVEQALLLPNSRYPYDSHVPLLRGRVTLDNKTGPPIVAAEIQHQSLKVFSNGDGDFTLPVRFPAQDTRTAEESTEKNLVRVKNGRGYVKAVLQIEGAPPGSTYRVDGFESLDKKTYEATLKLAPVTGQDFPVGVEAEMRVTLLSFALRIDTETVLDYVHDIPPKSGFQELLRIAVSPTP